MMRRLTITLMALLAVLLAPMNDHTLVKPEIASAQRVDECGFGYVDDRRISKRKHVTCSEAKRVLRWLRGNRRAHTIPMVCRRHGVVKGWHLTNIERTEFSVVNRYQRGRVSFIYDRIQPATRDPWCPPFGIENTGS
jgi:hypothetical protein